MPTLHHMMFGGHYSPALPVHDAANLQDIYMPVHAKFAYEDVSDDSALLSGSSSPASDSTSGAVNWEVDPLSALFSERPYSTFTPLFEC